jgi:tetratricopeptide (TPR) repeat protein/transcriptional regulator with XRE-family HTH domain
VHGDEERPQDCHVFTEVTAMSGSAHRGDAAAVRVPARTSPASPAGAGRRIGEPGSTTGPFGQLLRHQRTGAGLSQEELARAALLSTRTISDLERGVNVTARHETARLLADALGLTGSDRTGFLATARGGDPGAGGAAATRALPRDLASFTGRGGELARLQEAAAAGGIYVIGGMAGVGKTAFAVHAAAQLAPLFPDGQVFLPLHAHAAGRRPAQPADALASLLQTTGVAAAQIPASPDARASLWRSRVSGQRLLLVLDDAAGTDQVRPLLPGTGSSLVLITSRRHLTALEDARVISLDTLSPADAAALLSRLASRPDLQATDPAIAQIAELCGRLPLALGMLARQLYHHPSWTPAGLAADLASARDRLDLMHAENLSVAAAFTRSYQDLSAAEQNMFRCLGLHPGTDFDAYAAAALAGVAVAEARRDLEGLYDHYLLTETARGRYCFHDLIREQARALAAARPAAERDAAAGRLLDYYLQAARDADRHLSPRPPGGTAPAGGQPSIRPVTSRHEALAWLNAERLNLHAAVSYAAASGRPGHAAGIPAAMQEFWRSQGHWDQALTLHHAALRAARDAGNQIAEARALTDLGDMQFLTDDYPAAQAALSRALQICQGAGDRPGQARALASLAAAQHAAGNTPAALASVTRALTLYQSLGDTLGEAGVMTGLGAIQQAAGDNAAAAASLTRALDLYAEAGSPLGQASALTELGALHAATAARGDAAADLQQALGLYRQLGDRLGEAHALTSLGAVQYATGDTQAAEASHTRALQLYRDLGDPSGEAEALNNIAGMVRGTGQPARARSYYQKALAIATSIGALFEQARALEGIGRCHILEGNASEGRTFLRKALNIYQRIGAPRGEGAHVLFAQIKLNTGRAGVLAGLGQHRRGRIDTYDRLPGGLSDRDRHTAVADRQFQDEAMTHGLPCQAGVERDVGSHMRRPFLVAVRECLIPGAHQLTTHATHTVPGGPVRHPAQSTMAPTAAARN